MIVTLTPNPSVDRTVLIDDIVLGSVNRGRRSWTEPSGKGVNVALALHAHEVPVLAVVTAGGCAGAQLQQMLGAAGLDTVVVPIGAEIRSNISLTQPNGSVAKINEPGPRLSDDEADQLLRAVTETLWGAEWLVCGGSLPTGLPAGWYGDLDPRPRRGQLLQRHPPQTPAHTGRAARLAAGGRRLRPRQRRDLPPHPRGGVGAPPRRGRRRDHLRRRRHGPATARTAVGSWVLGVGEGSVRS